MNFKDPPDHSRLTDEELVSFIAHEQSWAMAVLYDRYARLVFSLACKILNDSRAAEEVVQETFLRVWRRARTFEAGRGKFSSWLIGIAHNQCIDELRRRQARPQVEPDEDALEFEPGEAEDPAATAVMSTEHDRAAAALKQLAPEQRAVIELAYYAGLTQAEIAKKLNVPLGTVKTRLRLGLQRLRELMSRPG